jgi:hypothetical protein
MDVHPTKNVSIVIAPYPKNRSQIIGASDLLCPLKLLSELLCLLFPTGLEIRLDLQEFLLAEKAMVDAMDVPSRRI